MKLAAAAALLALALTGCAAAAAQPADKPASDSAALVAHVQDNWPGTRIPDAAYIRAEALFACKRHINSGNTPTNPSDELALIIEAADAYLC